MHQNEPKRWQNSLSQSATTFNFFLWALDSKKPFRLEKGNLNKEICMNNFTEFVVYIINIIGLFRYKFTQALTNNLAGEFSILAAHNEIEACKNECMVPVEWIAIFGRVCTSLPSAELSQEAVDVRRTVQSRRVCV